MDHLLKQRSSLRLAEKIFLRFYCLPPPEEPFEPRDNCDPTEPRLTDRDPFSVARRVFGDRFSKALGGQVFLDIGCGPGDQVNAAALAGTRLAVGVDKDPVCLKVASVRAAELGVADRVRFTTDTVEAFGVEWADVALSQNSFEHFDDPGQILAQVFRALRPGGQLFLTFSPPWRHPYGVHHMFMIKAPWAHFLFSERTILRVRQLYRPNKPSCWREVSLNQMTISKMLRLVESSGFIIRDMFLTPISPLPTWVVKSRLLREYTTSCVSVILAKPTG